MGTHYTRNWGRMPLRRIRRRGIARPACDPAPATPVFARVEVPSVLGLRASRVGLGFRAFELSRAAGSR
jgi:hypothetical protein